jgi:hypothetical protein
MLIFFSRMFITIIRSCPILISIPAMKHITLVDFFPTKNLVPNFEKLKVLQNWD